MSATELLADAKRYREGAARLCERQPERAAELLASAEAYEEQASHDGHHLHLLGTGMHCSCGTVVGITTVAFPVDADGNVVYETPTCTECGAEGAYIGPRVV